MSKEMRRDLLSSWFSLHRRYTLKCTEGNVACCFIWVWNSVFHTEDTLFENVFGSQMEKTTGNWKKLLHEEIEHYSYQMFWV